MVTKYQKNENKPPVVGRAEIALYTAPKGLARYIADYIQEEFSRGRSKEYIDSLVIQDAIDAYEGGAR